MKILAIGPDKDLFKKGSIVQTRQRSYGSLVEEIHIIVFASKKLGFKKQKIAPNVWVYPTNSSNKLSFFIDAYNLGRKILKDEGKWLISAQDPFESGVVGYMLKKKCSVPLQIQEHGDFFSTPHWRKESLLNFIRYCLSGFLIQKADGVRVVAGRIKKTLIQKGVPEEKITTVNVRTDIDDWSVKEPRLKLHDMYPKAGAIIITAGRLVKQKNIPLLIHSFKDVNVKYPDTLLLIIGEGSLEKKLKKLACDLQVDKQIVFLPWTDDALSYFKTADIYALSSNYEGWGRVIIEAMVAKLPTVMTNVGCADEVFKNNEDGFVVSVDDREAFSEALLKMIEDPTLRDRFARNAFDNAKSLPTEQENLALYKKSWDKCFS